ncbi:MAG: hypothetical protein MUE62_09060 [Burkholderiaceae bacterium]|nr:hypothetical protein [Burkholderiaceae bacterium]
MTACTSPVCSHSIGARLSKKLALFTMLVLGGLSFAAWMSVKMMIVERNTEDLQRRCELVATVLKLEARNGGEAAVLERLRRDAAMRGDATRATARLHDQGRRAARRRAARALQRRLRE